MLKFGLGPFQMQTSPDLPSVTHQQLYGELLEEVKFGDELGYDSVWLSEHHFESQGYCPSLLVAAGAIAAKTQNVKIGTGALILPLHDPIRVAEDAAVVDLLSNGRFILGVVAGYVPKEFEVLRQERKGRGRRMLEQMEILRRAWTGDTFDFEGRYYKYSAVSVIPKPVQRPIPIWIGASTPNGIRRAAQLGVPLMASPRHGMPELREHYLQYREYLKQYGKQAPEIAIIREVHLAESQTKAEDQAANALTRLWRDMYGQWAKYRTQKDDQGRVITSADAAAWESMKSRFVVGTVEHCIREIEQYRKELGMTYFIARMQFPGMPADKLMNSARLLAKEVMPSFR